MSARTRPFNKDTARTATVQRTETWFPMVTLQYWEHSGTSAGEWSRSPREKGPRHLHDEHHPTRTGFNILRLFAHQLAPNEQKHHSWHHSCACACVVCCVSCVMCVHGKPNKTKCICCNVACNDDVTMVDCCNIKYSACQNGAPYCMKYK